MRGTQYERFLFFEHSYIIKCYLAKQFTVQLHTYDVHVTYTVKYKHWKWSMLTGGPHIFFNKEIWPQGFISDTCNNTSYFSLYVVWNLEFDKLISCANRRTVFVSLSFFPEPYYSGKSGMQGAVQQKQITEHCIYYRSQRVAFSTWDKGKPI